MKKFLALATALCMMFAVVPFVFAEGETEPEILCECSDPDCTAACECDALTCEGDCCAAVVEEEEEEEDFFQKVVTFFAEMIFNRIQRLIERIIQSITGPALPFPFD